MIENPTYIFYWRKGYFWQKIKVAGHNYDKDQDKMILYLPNGGLREISNWNKAECKLGIDWVAATKQSIRNEAGEQLR